MEKEGKTKRENREGLGKRSRGKCQESKTNNRMSELTIVEELMKEVRIPHIKSIGEGVIKARREKGERVTIFVRKIHPKSFFFFIPRN